MAIKPNREYRNLGTFETRDEDESYIVKGYASTFEPYFLFEEDGYEYYEEIDSRAFENADMSDVVFLRDHTGSVLARTKNNALKLSVDGHGLFTETDLGLTEKAREMREDIKVGNYSQMSFSFIVGAQHFREVGNRIYRHIDSFKKLFDVSAVAFPQNPTTDIGLSYRSLFDGVIEQREAERLKSEKRARDIAKLKLKLKLEENVHGN